MHISSSGDSNFNKSKICSEWRISITNMILNIIIGSLVGIKQWRFELRTPLPKRGAQPLGHLPDKIWKIGEQYGTIKFDQYIRNV